MGRARADYLPFTPAEERRIAAAFNSGMSMTALAARFKREDSTIREILLRHGCRLPEARRKA